MRKHIQIKAIQSAEFNKVVYKVTEQTHRGAAFGVAGNKFYCPNGLTLASNSYNARDTDIKTTFWLRGSKTKSDNTCAVCTTAEFEKLVAAVNYYNAYNFPAPQPVYAPAPAVQNQGCSIIIG